MNSGTQDPFQVQNPTMHGEPYTEENPTAEDATERIKKMVSGSDLFVFMKGTPTAPQCGFSANTVAILNTLGKPFRTFDVLSDPAIRQSVKDYSNWPTIPQIYIKGKFIGGNDIVTEMYQAGELQDLVK